MSDTLQAVQEMLTVDPDKVILPESAVDGLSAPQISVMKETVAAVQTSFAVAGAALRSAAAELYHLKGVIAKRQWTKFLDSNALPVSKKQAQDLVNSYEYIRDMGLTDGDLVYISSRALNRLANANPDAQVEGAKRLKAGKKVSESDAVALTTAINESEMSKANKDKLKIGVNAAAKLKTKDDEISKLKSEITKLKKELSELKKIRSYTVTEVMKNTKFASHLKDALNATLAAAE